jgi:ATP-dependent phosphofructokinase / diphosphate-dependent phosphofructokinase
MKREKLMRVGILTGGGDAPGLNAVIAGATSVLLKAKVEVIGILDGFAGIYDEQVIPLTYERVQGIHTRSGTILGSTNKRGIEDLELFRKQYQRLNLSGLIAAGGDGTFKGLSSVKDLVKLIGVPKTIDNDLPGTELTFGHDSAVSVVAQALIELKESAYAHNRIMVVEAMGRTAGWIALNAGIAAMADAIIIPEKECSLEKLAGHIKANPKRGIVICAAEGAKIDGQNFIQKTIANSPETHRLGGVSEYIANRLEELTGIEARHVILGHLQRSHAPTAFDRSLSLEFGVKAAQLALKGNWNQALAYRAGAIIPTQIEDYFGSPRVISGQHPKIQLAQSLNLWI